MNINQNTNNLGSTISIIDQLKLPDNYSNTIGGIKLPTKPSFGKLNKHRFSRVHPGSEYQLTVLIVEDKDAGETYIATPAMAGHLGKNATPRNIRLAVDNYLVPKLVAEPLVDLSGRPNLWNATMILAIKKAETEWVRIESDMAAQQYSIILAANDLGEPQWPNLSMGELIEEVFTNKIISDPSHPYIRQLEGRI